MPVVSFQSGKNLNYKSLCLKNALSKLIMNEMKIPEHDIPVKATQGANMYDS